MGQSERTTRSKAKYSGYMVKYQRTQRSNFKRIGIRVKPIYNKVIWVKRSNVKERKKLLNTIEKVET